MLGMLGMMPVFIKTKSKTMIIDTIRKMSFVLFVMGACLPTNIYTNLYSFLSSRQM